ncbi:MAG TPA: biotin synthase, partial [Planctomycetota bacterium]|nr:biotin synthase [Planctomycetota bacterium]
ELQALCFLAGANSIFVGDKLLTTPNPEPGSDAAMLRSLGLLAVGE